MGVACDYHRGEDVLVKESRFHGTENFHPFFSRFRRVISRPGVEIRKKCTQLAAKMKLNMYGEGGAKYKYEDVTTSPLITQMFV